VTFEQPEHAEKAIKDYNGAQLDERILTIEYAASVQVVPKI